MGCLGSKEEGGAAATQPPPSTRDAAAVPLKQAPDTPTVSAKEDLPSPVVVAAGVVQPAQPPGTKPLDATDRFKQQHANTCDPHQQPLVAGVSGASGAPSPSSTAHNSNEQQQTAPRSPSYDQSVQNSGLATQSTQGQHRNGERPRAGGPVIGIPPEELLKDVQHLTWLGQGGYGAVYQGIWHGAYVAVKFISSETVDPASASYREAQLSTLLAHPNVVQAFWTRSAMLTEAFIEFSIENDGGEGPAANRARPEFVSGEGFGDPYGNDKGKQVFTMRDVLQQLHCKAGQYLTVIAMEYCDKGSLHQVIYKSVFKATDKWSDRIALRALIRSAREIAQGIWHLHNSGVIHGDMKPGNVLLKSSRSDRRGFVCKVSDFGLAHETFGASDIHASTWATINYMAPEHFEGHLGRPSDVYSFGIVLWEMYNAERPYRDFTQGQVMMGVRCGDLRPVWPPITPAPLVQLATACLAQDPMLRPTFEAIMQQLTNIEGDMRMEEYSKRNHQVAAVEGGSGAGVGSVGGGGGSGNVAATLGTSFSSTLPSAIQGMVVKPGLLAVGSGGVGGRPMSPPIVEEAVLIAVSGGA